MSKFKKFTHVLAVGAAGVGSFLVAHHDAVLGFLAAFPKSSIAGVAAVVIAAIYHDSK